MAKHGSHGLHGPRMWVISLLVGAGLGYALAMVATPRYPAPDEHKGQAETAPADRHGHEAEDRTEIATELSPVAFSGGEAGSPRFAIPASLPAQEDAPPLPGQDPAAGGRQAPAHEPGGASDAEHSADAEHEHPHHGPTPTIPLWLCTPFALLLLSIAVMPFVNERFWHHHFPDFAFALGALVASYYWFAFSEPGAGGELPYGQYQLMHTGLEYYSFIALIGGLYVASGGVLVNVNARGRPLANTLLLAFGAVIANIVGTTGASVLLIRPFMRMNKGRLSPMHVVMFIFIVSNCGGALTPIGDPPLYLGFLKGVPFEWTLIHLWPMWATTVGMLLAVFFVIDMKIGSAEAPAGSGDLSERRPVAQAGRFPISLRGGTAMAALALIIFGVFIDPLLKAAGQTWAEGVPVGPTFQVLVAAGAYFIANKRIHEANEFNFFPVKEVGLLFVGIFATMAPALGYLAEHGSDLGLNTPTRLYFGTGALSAVLDNAPTYLNFLQVALAAHAPALPLNPDGIHAFIASATGRAELAAISLGAVFFGAMTYIGNGPNFMVRAIAVEGGLRMPSFFGYLVRAVVILLPVLIVNWLIWVR